MGSIIESTYVDVHCSRLVSSLHCSSSCLEDRCIVVFVVFSATILILAHICGILTVSSLRSLVSSDLDAIDLLEEAIVFGSVLLDQSLQCDRLHSLHDGFLCLHA
jgi:hypothetical protein